MKSILYIIIPLLIISCSSSLKKAKETFLHGTWFLAGEKCDNKGKDCKEPGKSTVVEFTDDGYIIINQNSRVRRKFHVRGNYFEIEYDNKKITIRILDENTFLTEEKDQISKFMRVKG